MLHRHRVGQPACVADGRPSVVPLTYAHAAVCGHTPPGRKVAAARLQPHVCFQVGERWDNATWRGVAAEGVHGKIVQERLGTPTSP